MISQETVEFSLLVDGRRVSAHWHPSASISFSRSRKAQNRAVAQCTILLILHLWWDGGGAGYGGTRNSGRTARGLARSLGISSWTVTAHATNAAGYGSTTWRYSRSPVWLAALWHWLASLLLLWTCWPLFLVRGGWQTLLQACRRTETTSEWRSSCISIITDSNFHDGFEYHNDDDVIELGAVKRSTRLIRFIHTFSLNGMHKVMWNSDYDHLWLYDCDHRWPPSTPGFVVDPVCVKRTGDGWFSLKNFWPHGTAPFARMARGVCTSVLYVTGLQTRLQICRKRLRRWVARGEWRFCTKIIY